MVEYEDKDAALAAADATDGKVIFPNGYQLKVRY